MEYADTFAGLAKAISDAGVDPEILVWLESMNVCDINAAVEALQTGQLPLEQSACVHAMLIFALGPDQVPCVAAEGAVLPPAKIRRSDLPVARPTSAGSLTKALQSAQPGAREATLASFRRDVWAPSNQQPQAARWKSVSSTSVAQQSLEQASPSDMAGKPLAELAEKLAALAERVEALQNDRL